MSSPTLEPKQNTSPVVLPSTGSTDKVADNLPFGIYADPGSSHYSEAFLTGAAEQVSFTYKKLGGDVLDIELTEHNIYAAYEEATLEYSYIVNMHQAKNSLPDMMGGSTGSFDEHGNLSGSQVESGIQLRYPKNSFRLERRIGKGFGEEVGEGGYQREYSASVETKQDVQDYDLQKAVENNSRFSGSLNGKRIRVTEVFFRTPRAAWRFYGYYGGLNVVGNLHSYGQYADDSTFEMIPAWQNKLQAINYEDAIYTRLSHFSYELKDNRLRIFPAPDNVGPQRIWFRFYIPEDPWVEGDNDMGVKGINNVNTLPFENLPYDKINQMGKQWIRRFALSLTKEMLAQVRGKYNPIPIPDNEIELNASELLDQSQSEQEELRQELFERLDELTYTEMAKDHEERADASEGVMEKVPLPIYQIILPWIMLSPLIIYLFENMII